MLIRWHGHSCFEIRNSLRIVIDPHDGRSIGIRAPKVRADLVLITHDHFDHNATRVVKGDFEVIKGEGTRSVGDVKIESFKAYHDREGGRRRGEITMFRVSMEGVSILHVGDLGHVLPEETVKRIGNVDILMVPVGGTYTVDAAEAKQVVDEINPRVVIPMHYKVPGLSLSLAPVDSFLNLFPRETIYHVGNSVEFSREDLPDKTRVWVFSL